TRRDRRPAWVLAAIVLTTIFCLVGASTALAAGTDGAGSGSTAPWIQSDQADYAPGATVTLTGGNWAPGESVHLFVDDTTNHTWNHSADLVADGSGMIQDVFDLPNTFVSNYDVVATGSTSGNATASFTDGAVRIKAIPVTIPAPGAPISWVRYNNTTCNPTNTVDNGTINADTNGNGTSLPVDVSATQSVRLTAGS